MVVVNDRADRSVVTRPHEASALHRRDISMSATDIEAVRAPRRGMACA